MRISNPLHLQMSNETVGYNVVDEEDHEIEQERWRLEDVHVYGIPSTHIGH